MLAAAAREIGAGRLDQRVEPQSNDEFGSLVEAFNAMAGELAASRRKVERSTIAERKHQEVEGRRRYIETILERITTGVVSVDAAGAITTINSAAARLLSLDRASANRRRSRSTAPIFQPLRRSVAGQRRRRAAGPGDFDLARRAGAPSRGRRDGAGRRERRAGRRRPGARRRDAAHPRAEGRGLARGRAAARARDQESADADSAVRRAAAPPLFAGAPPQAKALVDECTTTIVGEVESLKGLVDEFSQFARMPAPRTVPTDLGQLIATLTLYNGLFADVGSCGDWRTACRSCGSTPSRSAASSSTSSTMRSRRWSAAARSSWRRSWTAPTASPRVIVADDGPGIPPAEREKLFLPYYSTKRRGSGLGLAIVRRIIAEHGGSIEVGDNTPHGTRFTIELPC